MAHKVRQMRRKGKHISLVSAPLIPVPTISSRVALIQALIPVALERVEAALQEEVEHLWALTRKRINLDCPAQ